MAKKIYLIDDERDFTELVKSLLHFEGYEVESSNNPVEALKSLEQSRFDAVVVDMMMPDLDGIGVIKFLRAKEGYLKTPFFVLSAKKLTDEERKFLLAQEVHFVPKPFDPHRLVELMRQTIPN